MLLYTLNYNQPELTDNLVNQLKFDSTFDEHELIVVDNGSTKDTLPKTTTHVLKENTYFGGGLNIAMKYFLDSDHDYMWFLSNDLLFHGPNIIQNVLKEVKENNLDLYSPSVLNTGVGRQCHWRQMWNWGTGKVREVEFIDFQAHVISKKLATIIDQYPRELFLGWGPDFYSGITAQENNLKVGVSDNVMIGHLNSYTVKQEFSDKVDVFSQTADRNMHSYFLNSRYKNTFIEYRQKYSQYSV